MKCPNCGSDDWKFLMSDLHGGNRTEVCNECGAIRDNRKVILIPRRNQPSEVKSLPDALGLWLWTHGKFSLEPVRVTSIDSDGTAWCQWFGVADIGKCLPGHYVKAVPPILLPEPVKDADADGLRRLADCWEGRASDRGKLRAPDLRRIADRLDSLAKETA